MSDDPESAYRFSGYMLAIRAEMERKCTEQQTVGEDAPWRLYSRELPAEIMQLFDQSCAEVLARLVR